MLCCTIRYWASFSIIVLIRALIRHCDQHIVALELHHYLPHHSFARARLHRLPEYPLNCWIHAFDLPPLSISGLFCPRSIASAIPFHSDTFCTISWPTGSRRSVIPGLDSRDDLPLFDSIEHVIPVSLWNRQQPPRLARATLDSPAGRGRDPGSAGTGWYNRQTEVPEQKGRVSGWILPSVDMACEERGGCRPSTG